MKDPVEQAIDGIVEQDDLQKYRCILMVKDGREGHPSYRTINTIHGTSLKHIASLVDDISEQP